ncbi:DNA-binding response regulator, OmpR family, contains REC and winged-helix (wHTH) domain [Lentzea albidocapillata subsp. violacea]|uniref:DNA-binding response regulator, OmpR family, contains REC and winged-helix (WHTH) domain n=1 Tax=Lentzea albidocapillata subsp. violacea TaxID=128104 RepID=A0A1G8YX23_9PSEU|nr:response regulator transcription factor [Lentzea albidocapillata]SDK06595.1 DNA-binding response regulator, OmpR family, contains REC and winged-helix (wHTH) domain [Lentzea albidocapillata subsp. violacea]
MSKVLVVEDDPVVQAALVHALTDLGHVVQAVGTAVAALREAGTSDLDLVILDLGLPDLDGVAALRMLRGVSNVPVIVATARGAEASVVSTLNAGADDYIVKPFSAEHLAARINALLRRTGGSSVPSEVVELGGLRIDLAQRAATLGDSALALSRREFDLLAYLAQRPGRVVSRREIIQAVWGNPYVGDDKTIDVHASWLRRKLGETAAHPRYLHTVRGVGFKLAAPE